jgi:hypothetical protein
MYRGAINHLWQDAQLLVQPTGNLARTDLSTTHLHSVIPTSVSLRTRPIAASVFLGHQGSVRGGAGAAPWPLLSLLPVKGLTLGQVTKAME